MAAKLGEVYDEMKWNLADLFDVADIELATAKSGLHEAVETGETILIAMCAGVMVLVIVLGQLIARSIRRPSAPESALRDPAGVGEWFRFAHRPELKR